MKSTKYWTNWTHADVWYNHMSIINSGLLQLVVFSFPTNWSLFSDSWIFVRTSFNDEPRCWVYNSEYCWSQIHSLKFYPYGNIYKWWLLLLQSYRDHKILLLCEFLQRQKGPPPFNGRLLLRLQPKAVPPPTTRRRRRRERWNTKSLSIRFIYIWLAE